MVKSKLIRIVFLEETLLLIFSLVWFWFSVALWVDGWYTITDLKSHIGVITKCDSVITGVKNKPLFKEVRKELRVTLDTEGDQVFTLSTTEDFGYITSKIGRGDSVNLFTKPKLSGVFGLRKGSLINHLIKDGNVIVNYEDYKKSIAGLFYLTFAFAIILLLVYISKLRKKLWCDFNE